MKIKNTKNKRYKKVSFEVIFGPVLNISDSELHEIPNVASANELFGFNLIDYNTGFSLWYNMENSSTKWSDIKSVKKEFSDEDGCNWTFWAQKVKVKFMYPNTYKNLCLCVYGSSSVQKTKADKNYEKGKVQFGKTSYYDKNEKSSCHFMKLP